jgi:hypothetical protein
MVFTKILRSIPAFVVSFFKKATADNLMEVIQFATPIVKTLAQLTPNRTVQEIVGAYEHYGVPAVQGLVSLPKEKRGMALADIAASVVAAAFPAIPTRLISIGVSTAYAAWSESHTS